MESAGSVTRSETAGSAALWFGILIGPLAWGLQILLGYGIEEIACAESARSEELLGIGVETVVISLHVVLFVLVTAGIAVSYRCLRRARGADASVGGRASWMAMSGVMVGVLFLIVIASGFFPSFFLETCDPSL